MGCALLALAQTSERHTLSGYVTDAASGETLIGATVWAEAVSQGVASNVYGFYTLTLPVDVCEVRVSYLGYTPQRFEVDLSAKDLKLNLELQPGLALKEAVVTGEKENRIEEQVQMSKMEIPIEQIKALPAIGGEVDLLKSLQLLPGVLPRLCSITSRVSMRITMRSTTPSLSPRAFRGIFPMALAFLG